MAGHGGRRPGAGRPRNTPNKITLERQEQVIREKREPLDRMLEAMAKFEELASYYQPTTEGPTNKNANEAKFVEYLAKMADMAAKAAPYCHHRLASMVHTGPNDSAIRIEAINAAIANMSKEDLTAFTALRLGA